MAIGQFNKITYDDINNLKNESITTKNIYASGTSATIGTSDNPFNSVYANQYYGRKFKSAVLIFEQRLLDLSMNKVYSLGGYNVFNTFDFLSFCSNGYNINAVTLTTRSMAISHPNEYGPFRWGYPNTTLCCDFYISSEGITFQKIVSYGDLILKIVGF